MDLSRPKVMGILNITPDSFYDGGKHLIEESIISRVKEMEIQGADIIDVGAYSSRPGAAVLSVSEEISRLDVALSAIQQSGCTLPISVDTFRSEVADYALSKFVVSIINDISGGEMDVCMYDVVAKHKAAYVIMHMKGTPQTMIKESSYDQMLAEILFYFSNKVTLLRSRGVKDVMIDPGFGFAKDLDQNYDLLSNLHLLSALELPILVGVSRKSMIYNLLDTSPKEALNGTTAVNMASLMKGASVLRVHDVKEAVECIAIFDKIRS